MPGIHSGISTACVGSLNQGALGDNAELFRAEHELMQATYPTSVTLGSGVKGGSGEAQHHLVSSVVHHE